MASVEPAGPGSSASAEPSYSAMVGSVYMFNLMLGSGLLALPKAFVEVGWILGLVGLVVLALFSYCTVTFIVEAHSIYNALLLARKGEARRGVGLQNVGFQAVNPVIANGNKMVDGVPLERMTHHNNKMVDDDDGVSDFTSPSRLYEIKVQAELGELCKTFFNKFGTAVYYVVLSLDLYGSLAVYAAMVAKSLTSIVCGDPNCFHRNATPFTLPCGNVESLKVVEVYRIMIGVFVVLCGPFIFFTLTKTKFLQLFTMAFRWFALTGMIVLAFLRIVKGQGNPSPNLFNVNKLPVYFGSAVFSFMCQYSIPAAVTPINNKERLKVSIIINFCCVVGFYSLILVTASYGFRVDEIQDLYTLNFINPTFFKYVLELFPVLTLSSNFPIVAIALRENLKTLFLSNKRHYSFFVQKILFPLVVIIPPVSIAYATYNVGDLVGYTGSYTGAIIQYLVPTFMVFSARKQAVRTFGSYENKYMSPFRHRFWIYVVVSWYVICFVFTTYYRIAGN